VTRPQEVYYSEAAAVAGAMSILQIA